MELGQAVDSLKICKMLFCLVGQRHVPFFAEYDRLDGKILRVLTSPAELADVTFQDAPERRRYLVNPGSVGQPRDGDPRSCYAIYDGKKVRWRRVEYNFRKTMEKIFCNHRLDPRAGERLVHGR